jgi:hypothetical protein
MLRRHVTAALLLLIALAQAQSIAAPREVVDIPTRPGVTQRFIFMPAEQARAAVILFAGGHGGLQIGNDGRIAWGRGNFLVRSAPLFVAQHLSVAIIDAPSDQGRPHFLTYFRQTREHAADIAAVIAWLKAKTSLPVWLIGTSRGTESVAYATTHLPGGGPDGIVLTSTILRNNRDASVPDLPLDTLKIPVLVVHHKQDGCRLCQFSDMPRLMSRLAPVPRHALIAVDGGESVGDPCEAQAYHGYNGIEADVVGRIAAWMLGE